MKVKFDAILVKPGKGAKRYASQKVIWQSMKILKVFTIKELTLTIPEGMVKRGPLRAYIAALVKARYIEKNKARGTYWVIRNAVKAPKMVFLYYKNTGLHDLDSNIFVNFENKPKTDFQKMIDFSKENKLFFFKDFSHLAGGEGSARAQLRKLIKAGFVEGGSRSGIYKIYKYIGDLKK